MNLLKHTTILGVISSTIFLAPLVSQALTVEEVPNPQTTNSAWVTDMANILSNDAEIELNQLISNLEQTNGAEIAIVTVPETAPADSPKTFATQLFNHWGIGKTESNNGILFLVSTGDNRVEIETGYGIEAILSDAQVGKIIDTKITPQYKHGNFDSGTLDGTKALVMSLDASLIKEDISVQKGNWNVFAIWAGIGIGIASIGRLIGFRKKSVRVFINPAKAFINLDRQDFRDVCCAKCKQPMEKVDNVKLTKVQKVAKKIGSVSYRGYKCSSCSNDLQPYSLLAYISQSSRYEECPECQDFTVIRTGETLEQSTYTSKGKKIVRDTCHCCDYTQEKTEVIPRLRRTYSNNGNSTNSSNGYYGGGSCGGFSGSSGGGFGGGSSGGGGAGGDF